MSSMAGMPMLPTKPTEYQVKTLAVIYTLEVIAIALVTFRLYCRIRDRKRLPWTDAFLGFALLLQIVVQVLNVFEILETLQQYQSKGWSQFVGFYATFITYAAFWCLRMSVTLLFLEIFPGLLSKIIAYCSIAVISISTLFCIFRTGACFWPLQRQGASLLEIFPVCVTLSFQAMLVHTATGLVFDVLAVILPILPVWLLNMSRAKKLSVTFVFALGWLTVASSAIRFSIALKVLKGVPLKPGMMANFTIFAAVEMHVGLIAASLLTSWRIIHRKLFPVTTTPVIYMQSLKKPSKVKDEEEMDIFTDETGKTLVTSIPLVARVVKDKEAQKEADEVERPIRLTDA